MFDNTRWFIDLDFEASQEVTSAEVKQSLISQMGDTSRIIGPRLVVNNLDEAVRLRCNFDEIVVGIAAA